jgi:hypothetical protein
MAVTVISVVPPQDAIYGFHNANIVPRLTTGNWKTRANVRLLGPASLYVWIVKGTRGADEVYVVEVETDGPLPSDLGASVSILSRALAYANGEAGGGLGPTTAGHRWPADQEAAWSVSIVASRR